MVVDAGPGADDITTGDASDRIVGDRGNDTINAGAGDDTMAWSNGDGDDQMNGQDGLDRIENNLGGADDVSQVRVAQRQGPLRAHQRSVHARHRHQPRCSSSTRSAATTRSTSGRASAR